MNYNTVPVIITGKDLDYLSDMFEWNSIAFKKCYHYSKKIENEELKQLIEEIKNVHYNNLTKIINTLTTEGGQNE